MLNRVMQQPKQSLNCGLHNPVVHRNFGRRALRNSQSSSSARCQASLSLHAGETTLSIPVSSSQIEDIGAALQTVFSTFAEKQKTELPKRYKEMEYRHRGGEQELALLELYCNPNAARNVYGAKVLVTAKTHDGVSVLTETGLATLKADLDLCKQQL